MSAENSVTPSTTPNTKQIIILTIDPTASKNYDIANGISNSKLVSTSVTTKCKRSRMTYERFLIEAKEKHGDKFNYSQITPGHIKNADSRVPIICNKCDHHWETAISTHIYGKGRGCPACGGNLKLTYTIVIERGKATHGDKYDYSLIDPNQKMNSEARITIRCKFCEYIWECSVNNHINNKSGCPQCTGHVKHTYQSVIDRSKLLHGNKFDYSEIDPNQEMTTFTIIIVTCNDCKYRFETTVNNHIHHGGCLSCAGTLPWTYERLVSISKTLFEDKYSYELTKPESITSNRSMLIVKCNDCMNVWECTLNNHINHKSECPKCQNREPWTKERFITESKILHPDRFSYDKVLESDIVNAFSKVILTCLKCERDWPVTIHDHISKRSGCPSCNMSKGELECKRVLTLLGIDFIPQAPIITLPRKRYDFGFGHNNAGYLLEFDGQQHFMPMYNYDTKQSFEERQERDILKTRCARDEGYRVIRIDYTAIDNIEYHIKKALESGVDIYYSDPEKYQHIISALE